MGVYKVGNIWYIDYYYEGRRLREAVGENKMDARDAFEARKGEIRTGKFHLKRDNLVPFESFAKEYMEYAKINKRSWLRDEIALKWFNLHFKGLSLSRITPKHIEDYKRKRLDKVKSATINRELAVLGFMFSLATKWKYTDKNPVKEVKSLQERKIEIRILNKREAEKLIESTTNHLRSIIIIALNTGMRRGEILNLCWSDIDFVNLYIFVKESKSGYTRKVPMNSAVVETLKSCKREANFIFYNPKTKGPMGVYSRFKTACKKIGFPDLRFHDLRHTAATQMVMSGIDLVTIKELLGHSKIDTTMRYAHPTPENKRKAVAALEFIFGGKVATNRSQQEKKEVASHSIKSN